MCFSLLSFLPHLRSVPKKAAELTREDPIVWQVSDYSFRCRVLVWHRFQALLFESKLSKEVVAMKLIEWSSSVCWRMLKAFNFGCCVWTLPPCRQWRIETASSWLKSMKGDTKRKKCWGSNWSSWRGLIADWFAMFIPNSKVACRHYQGKTKILPKHQEVEVRWNLII